MGSMALWARTMPPPRRKVRLARDRMMPGSTMEQVTSGPALASTSMDTMPPSTTTMSPTCRCTPPSVAVWSLMFAQARLAATMLPSATSVSTTCSRILHQAAAGSLFLHEAGHQAGQSHLLMSTTWLLHESKLPLVALGSFRWARHPAPSLKKPFVPNDFS